MMARAIGFIITIIMSWTDGTSAVRTVQQSDLKKDTEKHHKAAATERKWPHAGYNQQGQECRTDGHDVYTWDDYVKHCQTNGCNPTVYWNQARPAPCKQNHGYAPGPNNQQSDASECRTDGRDVYTWDDYVKYCQTNGCNPTAYWNQARPAPCKQNHGYAPGANNQQSGASECRTDGRDVYTWDDYVKHCQTNGCNPTTYWNQARPAPCKQNHGYAPGANNQQWGANDCRTYGGAVYAWDDYVQYCQANGCNPTAYWNKAQPAPCANANSQGGDHAPEHRRRWKQATQDVAKDLASDIGKRLLDKWLP